MSSHCLNAFLGLLLKNFGAAQHEWRPRGVSRTEPIDTPIRERTVVGTIAVAERHLSVTYSTLGNHEVGMTKRVPVEAHEKCPHDDLRSFHKVIWRLPGISTVAMGRYTTDASKGAFLLWEIADGEIASVYVGTGSFLERHVCPEFSEYLYVVVETWRKFWRTEQS